jgi:hypothetical protein
MDAVRGSGAKPVQPQRAEARAEAKARAARGERDERIGRSEQGQGGRAEAAARATIPAAAGQARAAGLDGLIDRAGSMMGDLEKQIAELAGKKSEDINPAKMMQLQLQMTKVQQLFELASNIVRSRHEMASAAIRNIV